jgi:P27 family predicted phage terminase small subunit
MKENQPMKRGPKPVPKELRELHGNPRQHALPAEPPEGVGALCEAPVWMDDEQRLQWDYALEHAPYGLLTGSDREILAAWCVHAVEFARAVIEVRKLGQVVKTKDGNAIQNPFLAIVNRQSLLMQRAGAELGFSPAARMSIALGAGEESAEGTRYIGSARPRPSRLDDYLAAKPDKLDS